MATKTEPKHRGTLVCVVLKAKNLPNKRAIGKQDPYCVLQLGTEQQKTKPDKRGGQHPQWDAQLHFEIYDDMEDQLRKVSESETLGKSTGLSQSSSKRKDKAGKSLRVSCYADDNKEPEFIGEGIVDLTDTLRSGEFDEWVTIKAKDRYAGEVYLELTFYSAAAPPKPKKVLKPTVPANTTYGGAGTFSEDFDESEFAPRPPTKANSHAPIPSTFMGTSNGASVTNSSASRLSHHVANPSGSSMSASQSHAHIGGAGASGRGTTSRIDGVPSSLRPSASLAHIDSYTPPYAPQHIQRERSPAPSTSDASASTLRQDTFPPLTQSASAQYYGHRLPDAAPSSVVAQRFDDSSAALRRSQQLSSSSTFHHLPHAVSTSTIRPQSYLDASVDDLVRPLSSMSMQTLPKVAESQQPPAELREDYVNSALPPANHPYIQQGQQPHELQHSQSPTTYAVYAASGVDQFGRPLVGQVQHAIPAPLPPQPTPPPHSHSAPPISAPYEASPATWQHAQINPPPSSQLPSQPSISHYLGSPTSIPQQSVTPGVPTGSIATPFAPPPRAHTPRSHASLPAPPVNVGNAPSVAGRPSSPAMYAAPPVEHGANYPPPGQNGYAPTGTLTNSPPKQLSSRPLPSIGGPTPTGQALSSSAYGQSAQSHPQPQPPLPPASPLPFAGQQLPSSASTAQMQQYASPYAGYPPPPPSGMDDRYGVQYAQSSPSMAGVPHSTSAAHLTHYPPPPPGPPPAEYATYGYGPSHGPPVPTSTVHTYAYPAPQSSPQHQPPYAAQQPHQYPQYAVQAVPGHPSAAPPPVHPHPPASYYQPTHQPPSATPY